ncbi:exodeoxyribonuclease III [Caulobacter sp. S45]|uniref:exodeoxyribonuclease III n=1 Tax=Caulobacter sp. S45 TaxID=1641861 RepID=UPI00131B94A1|nr:exodeoxyribonuclease III [Caulobacter sp. S45]
MRIATWNVNSVNARLELLLRWLEESQPDVVCLQELKCVDEKFPSEPVEALGYNILVHGQKSYNGVALLSKYPMEEVRRGLPDGDEDTHSRYLEAIVEAPSPIRIASIYLPNGNPIGTEKFNYKLAWMERLRAHAAGLLALEEAVVLAGDFNVIPTPLDCDKPSNWVDDALFQPESRAAHRAIVNLGYTDAHLAVGAEPHAYTYWDYFRDAFENDRGIRIDHLLLSPQAADRLEASEVQRHVRGWERPSDHTPVMATLAD